MQTPPLAHPSRRHALVGLGAWLAAPAGWAQAPASRRLTVGVEAALQTSGLAQRLAAALARDVGLAIAWRPGPSGLLLPELERGELDAALTQSPEFELALERKNLVHDRRPVARTELVLVGPAPRRATGKKSATGDPAGVAGGRDIAVALAQVAASGARGEAGYVGHGEPSGERALEQALWKAAGPLPLGPWWRTAGAGPAAALDRAREEGAYALVERGVWAVRGAGSGLAVLVEGDPRQTATYHVMRAFRAHHPAGKLLVSWLTGRSGQRVVAGFGRGYRAAG